MSEEVLSVEGARDVAIILRGPDYKSGFDSLRQELGEEIRYHFAAPCGVVVTTAKSTSALDLSFRPYVESVYLL